MQQSKQRAENTIYNEYLCDTSVPDLVHVLVRRLTRNHELYAARQACARNTIRVRDASLTEILVSIQTKLADSEVQALTVTKKEEFVPTWASAVGFDGS